MAAEMPLHATQVLAVASHVSYGYVGNKMATFVMQALGCDVSAIDTVHFSNHTAYKQFKGRKVPVEEVEALWEGLQQSELNDFDMMLSGYAASKDVVELIGKIARGCRYRTTMKPRSFFWILDPVMGDEGRLYVAADIVPAYRSLLPHADLILPNAYEAELLSKMQITDMPSLIAAITELHTTYQTPHIIVTSLRISPKSGRRMSNTETDKLVVVGSTMRADHTPRPFVLQAPSLPIFFSGTGDMFAALMLCRLREAVQNFTFDPSTSPAETNTTPSLLGTRSWIPPDSVPATELPLAKATEKVLASMHAVLMKTAESRAEVLKEPGRGLVDVDEEGMEEEEKMARHLKRTKASEVRVVKYVDELRHPPDSVEGVTFKAEEVKLEGGEDEPEKSVQDEREDRSAEAIGKAKGKDRAEDEQESQRDNKQDGQVEDEQDDKGNKGESQGQSKRDEQKDTESRSVKESKPETQQKS